MQRFKYELTLLWSGTGIKIALAFYVITAIIAVIHGIERIEKEKVSQQLVQQQYEKSVAQWQGKVVRGEKELGQMGYYLLSPTHHKASPWATLFYGQRDLDLLQQHIRLLALEGQIHATEINNPETQVSGYMDLGFVLVYLLPLIIGLMCATLYAHEEAKNRWVLLTALAGSGMRVLVGRLRLRFWLITGLNFMVLGLAMTVADISIDRYAALIFVSLVLYQLFWFSFCGLIIQLRLKAATSTLGYVAFWLVLMVIIPGSSNLYLTNRYNTDESIALVLKQRQVMNDAWDRDKKADFSLFLQQNPQYADTTPLAEPFDWKWYYAMQQMSDLAAAPHLEKYVAQTDKRVVAGNQLAWFSVPLTFHHILTQIAQTDAASHKQYLQQIRQYHQYLRDFYYARIFNPVALSDKDFSMLPRFAYHFSTPTTPWKNILVLLLSTLMMGGAIAYVRRAKNVVAQRE